jgi:hypothetical protein
MPVLLTGTGSLPQRLGRLIYALQSGIAFLGSGDLSAGGVRSLGVLTSRIEAEYLSTNQDVISGIRANLDAYRSSMMGSLNSDIKAFAEQTVIDMVHADNPLPAKDLETALIELIRQIRATSDSVDASATTATVTYGSGNTGSAIVVCSLRTPRGDLNELVIPEDIKLICTGDAQPGGTATEGQEEWTFAGENALTDTLDVDWPDGSGASGTLTAVDAALDEDGGNLLTNSDFEDFTASAPDDWVIAVGAAATDIDDETSVIYAGTKALKFVGTGSSPLSSIYQVIDTTNLEPRDRLHWNGFVRKSASLSAGALRISLRDGSGTILTDEAGNSQTSTIANGTFTTSFAANSIGFTLPRVMPTALRIYYDVPSGSALTSGESIYIDHTSLTVATEAYTGGPMLSVHSGATDSIRDDAANVAIANDRAGTLQEWFDRLFDMKGKGLQLPSNSGGTETISDAVVA